MSNTPDLEARVETRKHELIAELVEHKKSMRPGSAETIDRLKARLSELAHIVKGGIVDGWANVGPSARTRLETWIAQ